MTEEFEIKCGVRQGGIESPILFTRCVDEIMSAALKDHNGGILIAQQVLLNDLDFADDIDLIESDPEKLQDLIDKVSQKAAEFGLKLNHGKCKVLSVMSTDFVFKVNGKEIETVQEFTYLGSTVTPNGNIDIEVQKRIHKATAAFSSCSKLWNRKDLSIAIKIRLYKALIRPVLLYAAETWPAKVSNLNRMKSFENRCIRKIAGRWSSREKQGMKRDIPAEIIYRKWKYLGHILRMPDERLPKSMFFFNPPGHWKRPPVGVRMTNERYFRKECEKLIMKPFNLSRRDFTRNWKSHLSNLASDRVQWREIANDMANTQ